MAWLFPSVSASLASSVILCLIYFYLNYFEHDKALKIWAISWAVYSLRFLFLLIIIKNGNNPLLLIANQLCTHIFSILMLWGASVWANKKIDFLWLILFIIIAIWIPISVFLKLPFIMLSIPTFFTSGFVCIWAGFIILQTRGDIKFGVSLSGWTLVIWGIHKLDFPFLRPIEWFAPWGYLFGAILGLTTAVGILLLYFEKNRFLLSQSEQRYKRLTENARDMIYRMSLPDGVYDYVSPASLDLFGYRPDEFYKSSVLIQKVIHPDWQNYFKEEWGKLLAGKMPPSYEYQIVSKFGEIKWMHQRNVMVNDDKGNAIAIEGIVTDITERKIAEEEKVKLQAQLDHRSKMDAVGQLAGGVAHDFNNLLSGIMGSAQLLKSPKRNLKKKDLECVDIILQASTRAARLISKLLAFGRKAKVLSTAVDCNGIIDDAFLILKSTIDKSISISVKKSAENHIVVADSSGLQNALINLGINASQAMPEGGDFKIETKNIKLNKTYCNNSPFEIEPGEYIEIEMRDTGCGIALENLQKIFEPFYTTKEHEKGRGLGLAAVYGTVLAHHGAINVYSEEGQGTAFHILLPCTEAVVSSEPENVEILTGSGKILLVDDEEIIRITGKQILEEMGYSVFIAENGHEAVEIFNEKHNEIDLVIMDVIMPEMNGRDAFIKMKEIDDNCKVVLSSGFANNSNIAELKESGLAGFIHKPYRDYELSKLLVDVLKS